MPEKSIRRLLNRAGDDIVTLVLFIIPKRDLGNLEYVITLQSHLVNAKMGIVKKLNSVKGLTDTFIKTSNGFKVVNPEGYVAIDRVSGDAVKLVDRMEFSFNNFTAIKAWDK